MLYCPWGLVSRGFAWSASPYPSLSKWGRTAHLWVSVPISVWRHPLHFWIIVVYWSLVSVAGAPENNLSESVNILTWLFLLSSFFIIAVRRRTAAAIIEVFDCVTDFSRSFTPSACIRYHLWTKRLAVPIPSILSSPLLFCSPYEFICLYLYRYPPSLLSSPPYPPHFPPHKYRTIFSLLNFFFFYTTFPCKKCLLLYL